MILSIKYCEFHARGGKGTQGCSYDDGVEEQDEDCLAVLFACCYRRRAATPVLALHVVVSLVLNVWPGTGISCGPCSMPSTCEGPGVAARVVVVARNRVSDAPLGEPFRVLTKESAEKVRMFAAVVAEPRVNTAP